MVGKSNVASSGCCRNRRTRRKLLNRSIRFWDGAFLVGADLQQVLDFVVFGEHRSCQRDASFLLVRCDFVEQATGAVEDIDRWEVSLLGEFAIEHDVAV